jgi:hypothetical protein
MNVVYYILLLLLFEALNKSLLHYIGPALIENLHIIIVFIGFSKKITLL